ncbi:MAG: nascent polypeptide-associated complex protein, partial [Thermoplasmata archaeon]
MMRINDRQIQRMIKQMGMKTVDIDATEVLIKGISKDYKIKNPKVTIVEVQGQKIVQIMGDIEELEKEKLPFSEEDIKIVMEQTGATREEVIETLKSVNGKPADAII